MKRAAQLLSTLVLGTALTGCVPEGAGYSEVRSALSAAGHDVRWHRLEGVGANAHTARNADATALARPLLTRPLTVESAVRLALLNNPEVQAAFEQLGIARAELIRASAVPNPLAEAALGFDADSPVGLSVSEDLSALALIPLQRGAAQADLEATRADVAGRILDIVLEARRAYYTYVASQQRLELRRSVERALAAGASAAEAIHAAGNLTDLDLESQRVLAEEARLNVVTAEAAAQSAREGLSAAIGSWGGKAPWQVEPRLPEPGALDMDGLENLALERSLELERLRQSIVASSLRAKAARVRGWLPELKAGVELEREESQWSYGSHLELEVPLFYQGQGEVARAEAEMRQSEQGRRATMIRIRAAVRSVAATMVGARERVLHLRDALLPLRQRVLQQTQLQYNAMGASVFQLLLAQRDQVETASLYVDTLEQYWLAAAQLEQLRAGRLPTGTGASAALASAAFTTSPGGDGGGH